MPRLRCAPMFFALYLCLLILTSNGGSTVASSALDHPPTPKHQQGICAMYGQCGPKVDSFFSPPLNCPANIPAVKPSVSHRKLYDEVCGKVVPLGPEESSRGLCCDSAQLETLAENVKVASTLLSACPACHRSFMTFFCSMTCSPDQSTFMNVTGVMRSPKTLKDIVISADVHVLPKAGEAFYAACKDVKFPADNRYVMDLIGGGATNYVDMLNFLGKERMGGSPFTLNFPPAIPPPPPSIRAMELPKRECNSTSILERCACVDCAAACPILPPSRSPLEGPASSCQLNDYITCMDLLTLAFYNILLYFLLRGQRIRLSGAPSSSSFLGTRLRHWMERLSGQAPSGSSHPSHGQEGRVSMGNGDSVKGKGLLYRLVYWNASHPRVSIALGTFTVLFLSLLSLGSMRVETNPERLWVAPNSRVAQEKAYFDRNFGPFYRTAQLIIRSEDGESPVLTEKTLRGVFKVIKYAQGLRVKGPTLGSEADEQMGMVGLEDVCFNPWSKGSETGIGKGGVQGCVVQSVAGYWEDEEELLGEDWKEELRGCTHQPALCLPSFGQPIRPEMVIGNGPYVQDDILSTPALIITWVLRNSLEDKEQERAIAWEKALLASFSHIDHTGSLPSLTDQEVSLTHASDKRIFDQGVRVAYSVEISVEQELNQLSNTDPWTIIYSYLAMALYLSFALGRVLWAWRQCDRRPGRSQYSRILHILAVESGCGLGLGAIAIVIGSTAAAIGVLSRMGVAVTLIIAEVVPFLVLAIGVDNVFLLVGAFRREERRASQKAMGQDEYAKIAATAVDAMGPSILGAATAECFVLGLGILVGMPAVSAFAAYSALSIIFDTGLQLLIFPSILVLDAQRRQAQRMDIFCFIRLDKLVGSTQQGEEREREEEEEEEEGLLEHPDSQGDRNHSMREDDVDADHEEKGVPLSLLEEWVKSTYSPWLLGKGDVRRGVLLGFIILATVLTMLATRVELGLDQKLALPDNSYLINYFEDVSRYLQVGPPVYFVVRPAGSSLDPSAQVSIPGEEEEDVRWRQGQQALCGRFTTCHPRSVALTLEGERKRPEVSFINQPASVWLDDFFHWLNPVLETCCRLKKGPRSRQTPRMEGRIFAQDKLCAPEDDADKCLSCMKEEGPGAWNVSLAGLPEGDEFNRFLNLWLQRDPDDECPLAGRVAYGNAISLSRDSKGSQFVEASHVRTYHTALSSQRHFIEALRSARRISKSIQEAHPGLSVFPYSVFYLFFEQYIHLWSQTLGLLGLAVVGVGVIIILMLLRPGRQGIPSLTSGRWRIAGLVGLCVGMSVTGVLGVMTLWGVSLNAVSLVNLLIALGINVEFTCHLARAYLLAPYPSSCGPGQAERREKKMERALVEVGSSVFSGITITKLIGISILGFSSSKIFLVYYFRMYLAMVVLGAAHGLILLPVLLVLYGGDDSGRVEDIRSREIILGDREEANGSE